MDASTFADRQFVVLGKLTSRSREVAEEAIVAAGGHVGQEISAGIDVAIVGLRPGGKLHKAEALGVEIWDEAQFEAALAAHRGDDPVEDSSEVLAGARGGESGNVALGSSDVQWIDDSLELRRALSRHPNTPPNVLEELALDEDDEVRKAVVRHRNTPTRIVVERANGRLFEREAAAGNPDVASAVLEELAGDKSIEVRRAVAGNLAASASLLKQLASDNSADVRQAVASNPGAPPAVLLTLVADDSFDVLRALAGNTCLSAGALKQLAAQGDLEISRALAGSPRTSAKILTDLAMSDSAEIREVVAANSSTPAVVLVALGIDPDVTVRAGVAANGKTPKRTLKMLANDATYSVRRSAAASLGTSQQVDASLGTDDRQASYRVTSELLVLPVQMSRITRDKDVQLRAAVAGHPDTPPSVVLQLARDRASAVRSAACANPAMPLESLKKLAQDESMKVRLAVVSNPECSRELLTLAASNLRRVACDKEDRVQAQENRGGRRQRSAAETHETVVLREQERVPVEPGDAVPSEPVARGGQSMRVITLKFGSRCRDCNAALEAGSPAWWAKGEPPVCMKCGKASPAASATESTQKTARRLSTSAPPAARDGVPMKSIHLKFGALCRSCDDMIQTGELAWWAKDERPLCIRCGEVASALGLQSLQVDLDETSDFAAFVERGGTLEEALRLQARGVDVGYVAHFLANGGSLEGFYERRWEGMSSVTKRLKSKKVGERIDAALQGLELGLITIDEAHTVISRSKESAYEFALRWLRTGVDLYFHVMVRLKYSKGLSQALTHLIETEQWLNRSLVLRVLELKDTDSAQQICELVDLDPDMLDALSRVPSRRHLTGHDWMPPSEVPAGWVVHYHSWRGLSFHPKIIAALNPLSRQETLARLAKDKFSEVRRGVAANPAAGSETLMRLALDPDGQVRASVAGNRSASNEVRAAAVLVGVS